MRVSAYGQHHASSPVNGCGLQDVDICPALDHMHAGGVLLLAHSFPFPPFPTLSQVLYGVNQRVRTEDVDSPLCEIRPVKSVQLVVVTGERGLCGGYNNFILKKVCVFSGVG